MVEFLIIYENDIKNYFFKKLLEAGVVSDSADLQVISNIVFDYLIDIGILHPDNISEE